MLKTYKSKRKPRAKQAIALRRCKGRKVFALRMAMRVGKSKVVLDDWGPMAVAGKVTDLLVIAPAGAYRTWLTAMAEDLPDEFMKEVLVHVWDSRHERSASAKRILNHFLAYKGPRALLVNVEALSDVDAARELCLAFAARGKCYGAIDESVVIKNPTSECAKFCVIELAPLLRVRRILTGLIAPKSPLDLYAQFAFLDKKILGFSNYRSFKARYAVVKRMCFLPTEELMRRLAKREPITRTMERDEIIARLDALKVYVPKTDIVVNYRHVDELYKKIDPHSYRVKLEDCYDLPPSTYAIREVQLTPEQRKAYSELKEFYTTELANGMHVTATQVIVRMLRLHQILCGHTRDEESGWHAIPERRTKTLLDLLADYEGKAIVWCSYDADVQKVALALAKEFGSAKKTDTTFATGCVARFWGGNRKTREAEERRFKTEAECRFMVATASAGGRGRTWDAADLVVYYSNRDNLDHRMQSEERPKGVGKTTPIEYVDLLVPGTVDEKIVHAMRKKLDMATTINGDNYQEWLV